MIEKGAGYHGRPKRRYLTQPRGESIGHDRETAKIRKALWRYVGSNILG